MRGSSLWLRSQLEQYPAIQRELDRLWVHIPGTDSAAAQLRDQRRRAMNAALAQMDPAVLQAVYLARQQTLREPGGEEKLLLEELVTFRATHTLAGAALVLHCHTNTAGNWHRRFLRKVRENIKRFNV